MKKITDGFLFSEMDKKFNLKNELMKITEKNSKVATFEEIEENLLIIRRRFNYSSKLGILKEFEKNALILLTDKEKTINVPKALPVWLRLDSNNNITAMINISKYSTYTKNTKMLTIDNRTLYALLQFGYIVRNSAIHFTKITSSVDTLKAFAEIYVKMIVKVLDKLFSLTINKKSTMQASYLIAKFFLSYLCEKTSNEYLNNLAYKCIFNPTSSLEYLEDDFISRVDSNWNGSIATLINELSKIELLEKLNLRTFIENWMLLYGESTILSLEYLPYFFAHILSSIVSGKINRDFAIDQIAGMEINKIFNTFFNLF